MPKANNNRADRGVNRKAGNAPKLTPEQERTLLAKSLGIKPKTKEFIDLMLADPKLSATEAYIRTHQTVNRDTAKSNASTLLTKTNVNIYKDSAVSKAKRKIVSLVDSGNESIALKASVDILDRTAGKAIQRNETTTNVVRVSLDLSGTRIGAHYVKPELLQPETPKQAVAQ